MNYDDEYMYDYEGSALKKHKLSDKIKWVITAVAGILLTAAVVGLTANAAGVFGGNNTVTYRFEAEDAALDGGCEVIEIEDVACVGEFINNNTVPHTVTYTITSSADAEAGLYVCISADSVDRNLSDFMTIVVNGVTVNVPYRVVLYADPRTWADWRVVEVCNVQLNDGENTIVFTGDYPGANFDYIEFVTDKNITLTATPSETNAAEVSNASEGIMLTATIQPETAENKAVDWEAEFVNPSSSRASGKDVSDYVTITPASDEARTSDKSLLNMLLAE